MPRRLDQIAQGSPEAYAWAERMKKARESRKRDIRALGRQREKEFFGAARNPQKARRVRKTAPKRYGENPIAIVGNPPKSVFARVEGVLYNRIVEIRAQKTGWKKGFYKHPFETDVQLLALDNGDLLVHSVHGYPLWENH